MATKLGVKYSYVRAVARGKRQSESVLAALKEGSERSCAVHLVEPLRSRAKLGIKNNLVREMTPL